jgi:hypothetical protein
MTKLGWRVGKRHDPVVAGRTSMATANDRLFGGSNGRIFGKSWRRTPFVAMMATAISFMAVMASIRFMETRDNAFSLWRSEDVPWG